MAPHERAAQEGSTVNTEMLSEPLVPMARDHECVSHRNVGMPQPDESGEILASDAVHLSPTHNITVVLYYTCTVFAGRSIWNQNVLANFVYLLKDGDPEAVGFLTAAMGISQLLVSFPSGYLADKYRRDNILKVSSAIGVSAIATSLVALVLASFRWLLVSLCVWGVYWGCAQTAVTALFADSIPDGQRSHHFTTRSVLIKVGQLTGPVVALGMFAVLGDHWTIHDCSVVMMVGQLICLPAVFLLCFLNDDATPRRQEASASLEEPLLRNQERSTTAQDEEQATGSLSTVESELEPETAPQRQQVSPTTTDTHSDETYDSERLGAIFPFVSQERIIPTLVATADATAGLASGMSIRYFAIFLVDNLHIDPVFVQVLYIIAPLLQVVLMKLIEILARKGGRCYLAVAFKWVGISLMLAMVVSYLCHWPVWITCTILTWRTAFMNSPSALTRSVLMDHAPKSERAKWSALESLNMFSWSGSAVIGGILVDKEGIVFNFCTTAGLQFFATIPLVILSCHRKISS